MGVEIIETIWNAARLASPIAAGEAVSCARNQTSANCTAELPTCETAWPAWMV
jgi:hypothetical protein